MKKSLIGLGLLIMSCDIQLLMADSIIYAKDGQSEEQQLADEATALAAADEAELITREKVLFTRHLTACLEGRGYVVN